VISAVRCWVHPEGRAKLVDTRSSQCWAQGPFKKVVDRFTRSSSHPGKSPGVPEYSLNERSLKPRPSVAGIYNQQLLTPELNELCAIILGSEYLLGRDAGRTARR